MKVLLTAINSKFIHSNLAVRYLRAYTKDLDYEYKIREFTINDRRERILEEIIMEKPDIVAFSCYIWNMNYVEELTKLLKLAKPDIKILLGGPEVSFDSENVMDEIPADFIIEGEGEEAYREFICAMLNHKDIGAIKSMYFRKNGKVEYGGKRELMDMNQLVYPYEPEENFDNKIVYYESSRGCPFNCKYCLSSTIKGVRFLNIERVKRELQYFIDRKVRLVKFVDRTFNCNNMHAISIWKFLISQNTDTRFHFEISADVLSDEQMDILTNAPAGRFQFEIGVQTTNNKVLNNINRHVPFEYIKKRVNQIKNIKTIHQHLDLIAGLPEEDIKSFEKSFNDVYAVKPEQFQLGFLKLLKGSSMREEADSWGIIYSPYAPYEVLRTSALSFDDLTALKHIEEMVDKYYNSQKFNTVLKYFENRFDNAFNFYKNLSEYFYKLGYMNKNISFADYYEFFIEFSENVLKEDTSALREIIKFDYLKYNKKKWLPPFLNREMIKNEERALREASQKELGNYHIEKFNIDILKFIREGIIEHKKVYAAFNEKNVNDIFYL